MNAGTVLSAVMGLWLACALAFALWAEWMGKR